MADPPAWKHALTGYVPERNKKGKVVPLTAEHRAARAIQPGERAAVGRKSGRAAPLRQLRPAAREETLAQHGLMEAGTADTRQGQLFPTEQYQEPITETAKRFGVTPPMASSKGGFLADIEGTKTRSAHERKITAIRNFAEVRMNNPIDVKRQEGAMAMHLEHLGNIRSAAPEHVDWYSGRGEEGEMTEGMANRGIRERAERSQLDVNAMTRATAVTSPRVPWTMGNPQYGSTPNLDSAESVGRAVARRRQTAEAHGRQRPFTHEEMGKVGQSAPGIALPLSKERAGHAFMEGEQMKPVPHGENYQKVPNFNESLQVGRQDLPTSLRGAYAGSYTSDMWDLAAKNLPEETHSRLGTYSVDKMLSTRAAFKRRELPSDFQAAVWQKTRQSMDPTPLTASVDVGGGNYRKMPSLLSEDQMGNLSPSFDFTKSRGGSLPDRRSETAKRMGIEF